MATLSTSLMPLNNYSATFNQLNIINQLNIKAEILADIMTDAGDSTDKFNDKLQATGASAEKASSKLSKYLNATKLIKAAIKGIEITDKFINTNSRLELVNDGEQTQSELQDKIFQAANRSSGSYMDMASTVSTLGSTAKDAFPTNDEAIAFSELLQKSMKISGVSGAEQGTTMMQVAQTMGKGTLTSGDFNSITNKVPAIMEALITATGKSEEELKGLASEGLMTADIIKNAMFLASDQINKQFDSMDVTFTEMLGKVENVALKAFEPVMEALNNLIKSDTFQTILNGITTAIVLISWAVGGLIDIIVDNWPLILSVLLAIGTYLTATLLPGLIKAGIVGLSTGLKTAIGWMVANAPLVLLIGIIALIIYALIKTGLTVEDVFNFILGLVNGLVNIFIEFGNFISNVFQNPISSVIYLFQGLADAVLGILETIASALDFVFGSNMADTVAGWRSEMKNWADKAVSKYAPNEKYEKTIQNLNLSAEDFSFKNLAYGNEVNTEKEKNKGADGEFDKKINEMINSMTGMENGSGMGMNGFGTSNNPMAENSKDVVQVDMSNEDLKYLRDIAERDYINNFSTATLAPQIQVQFGDVHQEADADKVAGRIKMILQEEIATAAEGVY